MPLSIEDFTTAKAWPFEEARKLVKRFEKAPPAKGYVLFETGYGPSGLPHIGTFGEVARTTMVRQAFARLSDIPTRLFAFSDDMDGLRKVPENLPNKEMVAQHLGKPLTAIPDPFGTHESFGHHMNARLRAFLDTFGFEYEFKSATDCYTSGMFDATVLKSLENVDKILKVMLPTLGDERQQTYSPFMPLCPRTGKVLQVPIKSTNVPKGTLTYVDPETGEDIEVPVTGGRCKMQWKADWAMRWTALAVDYEMYGKDLIPSAELSSKICRILGGTPPEGFFYELFLDEQGQKISKSKGNGLTIDEWLRYATPESLALYMYGAPRKAKRLHFDVIPKHVDEYVSHLASFEKQEEKLQVENPIWHIHNGVPPKSNMPVTFGLLLNLACACNPEDKSVLWGFISRYAKSATPQNSPLLDKLVEYAVSYYHDFIKPAKKFRNATEKERAAMEALVLKLREVPKGTSAEELQNMVYEVGKLHGFENLREWFGALYEVLLGQTQGPRMGSFIALYGVEETITLITTALDRKDAA